VLGKKVPWKEIGQHEKIPVYNYILEKEARRLEERVGGNRDGVEVPKRK